ncbi:MAG: fructose-2,6-bisphosphatase [Rubrivivax sp.]|nr:MAG: fructose-2,6-bisphosphatase [Rubrivivax sp.]
MSTLVSNPGLHLWRHPRPVGAQGRCIGGSTDLPVDPRKAKRLARRIQAAARRHRWPRHVWTSPLRRCADVGRWLRRWGWRHTIDPALAEMHFGCWDGQPWSLIGQAAVDDWCARFDTHEPGGGESLALFLARVARWAPPDRTLPAILVGHGGWMVARRWLQTHGPLVPTHAAQWPPSPAYGQCWHIDGDAQ